VIMLWRNDRGAGGCYRWMTDQVATFTIEKIDGGSTTPTPKLVVSCPTVTRGEGVTCTAAAEPADPAKPLTITGWTFEGVERYDDVDQLTWSGKAARSGVVRVTGTLGGIPDSAQTQLTVVNRTGWSAIAVFNPPNSGGDPRLGAFERMPEYIDDLGHFSFYPVARAGDLFNGATEISDGGPNEGVYYFADRLPFPVFQSYAVNTIALNADSAFWKLQSPTQSSGQTLGSVRCSRGALSNVSSEVEEHELAHLTVMRAEFTRLLPSQSDSLEHITEFQGDRSGNIDRVYRDIHAALSTAAFLKSKSVVDEEHSTYAVDFRDAGQKCYLVGEGGAPLINRPAQ
jgi:hypothetical protein